MHALNWIGIVDFSVPLAYCMILTNRHSLFSILSLATAAQQYNYVKPNMTSDDCLIIRDGR